ncbi:MAG: Lrp/AsnC family transcriptional regulator [Pseudomonadota bacterium]
MEPLALRLLNDYQRNFPLTPRPFAAIARDVGSSEIRVLEALRQLKRDGAVGRVGPVFAPHRLGASTLAAMSVPAGRLDAVAAIVSACAAVNHNYEREHALNLWFVACASGTAQLERSLRGIEAATGLEVVSLPLEEAYHLDLAFDLRGAGERPPRFIAPAPGPLPLSPADERLLAELQHGLPLVRQPYAAIAVSAQMDEAAVVAHLARWLQCGTVSRLGVVVHHRALGYRANAMAVWDVPDGAVAEAGRRVAQRPFVTLCYRRRRHPPQWRYNLFCMIHGTDRQVVLGQLDELNRECGLSAHGHAVLFSRRCFKQRGARYVPE